MKIVAFAALAGLTMTTAGQAADMAAPVGGVLGGPQYEVGSGWYIRGDFGDSLGVGPSVNASSIVGPPPGDATNPIAPTYGASASKQNFTFGGGFGYQFSPNFRMDATFDHYTSVNFKYTGQVVCPYNATGVFQAGIPVGVLYDTNNTCNGVETISNRNNVALVNAYYDLPMFGGLTPYVGAGVGLNYFHTSGSLNYSQTSNGANYAADLTLPGGTPAVWVNSAGQPVANPGIAFGPQNWNRSLSQTKITAAVALMAGVAYHFNDWVTLDLGYRYMNANIRQPTTNYSHDFRAGVRLYAN